VIGGGRTIMPRVSGIRAALCLLAAAASLCVLAASSVAAKHKSVAKHKSHKSSVVAKHRSRHKSSAVAKHTSSAVAEWKSVTPTPRTPVDKYDCITVSQAFYGRAAALSSQTKQTIPQDFERVVSKLDELCGEEEFGKARISIDWMDACLKNFTKDYKLGFCSRSKGYFCAIDPASDGCLQSQSEMLPGQSR
jgi:hypothetical protein